MRVYSVWATPTGEDAKLYEQIIETLAARLGAPAFLPHVTIGSVDCLIDLKALARDLRATTVKPLQIQTEPEFTRSLLVQLEASYWLRTLRSRAEALPGFRSSREFDPHISLCYGSPPPGAANRSDVKDLLDQDVRLTRLALMEISLPVETYEDVRSWREVAGLTML